jgi:hypothetical protein
MGVALAFMVTKGDAHTQKPPGFSRRLAVALCCVEVSLRRAVSTVAMPALPWDARLSMKLGALPMCRANDPDSPDAVTGDNVDQASVAVLSMVPGDGDRRLK